MKPYRRSSSSELTVPEPGPRPGEAEDGPGGDGPEESALSTEVRNDGRQDGAGLARAWRRGRCHRVPESPFRHGLCHLPPPDLSDIWVTNDLERYVGEARRASDLTLWGPGVRPGPLPCSAR